jgi:hypothetical protein
VYPDFIGIGAQKAGTTWLHHNLQAHPGIWMPKEKELHYFDEKIKQEGGPLRRLRGDRPLDKRWRRQAKSRLRRVPKGPFAEDLGWDLRYFLAKPGDRWYASLFAPGADRVTGEATPDYAILGRDDVAHVHEIMPDAKIIFIMRSPIERPWSAMDMRSRIRGESIEEIADKKFYRRFDARGSQLRTRYLRTLENWGASYPEEQIFIGFLEDIHFFPDRLLGDLYEFLGVDPDFRPPGADRRIHSGKQETIPTRFAVHLANSYHEELKTLHDRLGGYASFWLFCAERLIEDPPAEERVPYPLYASPLWEEWTGGAGPGPGGRPRYGSGTLASFRAARPGT